MSTETLATSVVNRFDHIEFATRDMEALEKLFGAFGFVATQERETDKALQRLLVQGKVRILLSQGKPGSFPYEYVEKHGDGVCTLAYHTPDIEMTFSEVLSRGGEMADEIREDKGLSFDGEISVKTASIFSFGDCRAQFIERSRAAFDMSLGFGPGYKDLGVSAEKTRGVGLRSIDHLTNNVEMGKLEHWRDFYHKIFGFIDTRYFDIKANKTGLHSRVLQSVDGGVKIPVNEATEEKSQVQEFIVQHKGAGVQHIALTTNDIRATVKKLRESGIKFLDIPDTYYEALPKRLQNVEEPLDELKNLTILADGDESGYLLQIFTENQVGPLFFEIIQRRGHSGFGEGNFQALFEAIERDQERRGVL